MFKIFLIKKSIVLCYEISKDKITCVPARGNKFITFV